MSDGSGVTFSVFADSDDMPQPICCYSLISQWLEHIVIDQQNVTTDFSIFPFSLHEIAGVSTWRCEEFDRHYSTVRTVHHDYLFGQQCHNRPLNYERRIIERAHTRTYMDMCVSVCVAHVGKKIMKQLIVL